MERRSGYYRSRFITTAFADAHGQEHQHALHNAGWRRSIGSWRAWTAFMEMELLGDNMSRRDGSHRGMEELPQDRSRMMKIVGLFLMIETAGLAAMGFLQWVARKGTVPLPAGLMRLLDEPSLSWMIDLPLGVIFLPLAALALVATLGFWRLWTTGWILAMSVQALSLLITLIFYFRNASGGYIYLVMMYCIGMVAYLNHSDVKRVFHSPEP
jgi:hypothetical protein